MPRISYPFAAVPNQIIRGGHGLTNIAVFAAILSHGKTTCSISTLARELGCDKKTILPAIRYWIENGPKNGVEILSKERNGCPTVYEIVVHEMREPDPETGQVVGSEVGITPPENGSGGDPKTGDLPHPKTGHKEEPIKKNPKENSQGFDSFWSAYPKKAARKKAEQIWNRLKDQPLEAILAHVASMKETDQWKKDGGAFIPHPTTYLNQERWNDDIPKPITSNKKAFIEGDPARFDEMRKIWKVFTHAGIWVDYQGDAKPTYA